jgi:hypothetical protein
MFIFIYLQKTASDNIILALLHLDQASEDQCEELDTHSRKFVQSGKEFDLSSVIVVGIASETLLVLQNCMKQVLVPGYSNEQKKKDSSEKSA